MIGLEADDRGADSERLERTQYPVRTGHGEPQAKPGLAQPAKVHPRSAGLERPCQPA